MIRVLLERQLAEGMEEEYRKAMVEMRNEAVSFPGYIEGESLRDPQNPHYHVVISTWRSLSDWDSWASSSAREKVLARLALLLEEPERITVLERL
jgi:heme-degrading monooxygenase HmoA